jgi:hypothetical protein
MPPLITFRGRAKLLWFRHILTFIQVLLSCLKDVWCYVLVHYNSVVISYIYTSVVNETK